MLDYNFNNKHKPGTVIQLPDSLSRYSEDQNIEIPGIQKEFLINNIKAVNIEKLQLEEEYLFGIRQAILDPV